MHLFLTITSILLQVVTSQLNSTSLPSAKEQAINTDGSKAGPVKARIMPLATELLLNVPQPFPQVQQDQMTDHQRVILEGGIKLLPKISAASANTSPLLRKKRNQQNQFDLGTNSQNESALEKHNTSIVGGKNQLSKEKSHYLTSQKNCAREKLEENEKLDSEGDDYDDDEEDDEDDDKNDNEEDDDDADDAYEDDKVNESGDTENDDEDASYKLKGKLKEYKSGEIEKKSGKSRDHQSYQESKDKKISDSICAVKSQKEQKKLQKEATEKKTSQEAMLTGNKAPQKSSDKQLKNTDNDSGAVGVKEKGLNVETTSQSKNLTRSQDSKMSCATGDSQQKQNDTKEKEIKQKKQKSREENKTKPSAGGDEPYFCGSKNNTTSHVDSEDSFKRADNQSPKNHGKWGKKMKGKDKKTKSLVEDKEPEATSTSKSNCPVPIRHENDMANNKSKKLDDEKYGVTTEVQTENLHSGTSASLKHEKNKRGKNSNCLEHGFNEENNAKSDQVNSKEKPKMKNEATSVPTTLKNAGKKVECPVKVLKNDKSNQEEKVKALQERIFLPCNQENLGKKKTNIPVPTTKSTCKNESLSTLFTGVNEGKTATAKTMTKSSTPVGNKRSGGRECTKLPDSNLGDTNDSGLQGDLGNVTQPEPLSSIENKTRPFDVLRSKLEKLGTCAGKKSLGKNKDTLGSNSSSPATVTTSDPCIKNEEETSEIGDELPTRQSVKYLSRVDKTKLQELLKDSGNNDKNRDWLKHNMEKNSFKKPFQMYINMLNSLTKKSLKSEAKKSKDLYDQERPKIASYDEMNSSPPIKYNNALEDTARDLLQVYISETNKPTMMPSNTENSRPNGQTSLPDGRIRIDLMPKEAQDEYKPVQSIDRTNLVELMFVPPKSKPTKSFFRKRLSKENGAEKANKIKKQKSKKGREPSIYEDIDEGTTEETKPEDTTKKATEDTTLKAPEDTCTDTLQMIALEKPRRSEIKALLHALSRSKVNKHPKFCSVDKAEHSTRSINGIGDGDSYNMRRTFREENEDNIEDSEDDNEERHKSSGAHRSDEETEIRLKSKRKKFSQFRLRDKKNKDKLNADMDFCTHKNRTRFRVVKMLMPHFTFKGSGKEGLDEYMNNKDEAWDKSLDLGSGDAASYSEESGKLFGKKHRRILLVRRKSPSHELPDEEEGNKSEISDPVSALKKLVRSDQKNGHNMLQGRQAEDDINNYLYSRGRRSTVLEYNTSMVPMTFYKNINNKEKLDNNAQKLMKKFENNETPFRNSIHTETISGSGRSTEEEINLVTNKRDTLLEQKHTKYVGALKFQRERLSDNSQKSLKQTYFSAPLLSSHNHYKGTSIDCKQKNFYTIHLHNFVAEGKKTTIQSTKPYVVKKNLQNFNNIKILNNQELITYKSMMTIPITQRTELQISALMKPFGHAEANHDYQETSSSKQNDCESIVVSQRLRRGMQGNATRKLTRSQIPLTYSTRQNTVHWNLKRQAPLKENHTQLINLDTEISAVPANRPDVSSCELDNFYPRVSILKIVPCEAFQHPQQNQLPPQSEPPSLPQNQCNVQDFKKAKGLLNYTSTRRGKTSERGLDVEENKLLQENTISSKEAGDGMKLDHFFDLKLYKQILTETMTDTMFPEYSSLNKQALEGISTLKPESEHELMQTTPLGREDMAKINCGNIMMTTEGPLIRNASTDIFRHKIVPKQVKKNQIICLRVSAMGKEEKNNGPNNVKTIENTPANIFTDEAQLADSSEMPINIAVVNNPTNKNLHGETTCGTVGAQGTVNDLLMDHLEKHSFNNIESQPLPNSGSISVNIRKTSTGNGRNISNFKNASSKKKGNQDTDLSSMTQLEPKNHSAESIDNMESKIEKRQHANPISSSDNKSDTYQNQKVQPTLLVINNTSTLYDNRMLQEQSAYKMTVREKEMNRKGSPSYGVKIEIPQQIKKQVTEINHDLGKIKDERGKKATALRGDVILPLGDNEINDITSIVETLEPVSQSHREKFANSQVQHVPCTSAYSSAVKLRRGVKWQQEGDDKVSDLTSILATEFTPPCFNQVKVTRNHVILRPVQFINDYPKNKYPFLPVLLDLNASKTQESTTTNSKTKSSTRWYQSKPETRLTNITFNSAFPNTTWPYKIDFTHIAKNFSIGTSHGLLSERINKNLPAFDQMKHPGASAHRLKLINLFIQQLKDANCEILPANLSESVTQNSLKRKERSQSDFETNFARSNCSNSIVKSGYDPSFTRLGRNFSDQNSLRSMQVLALQDLPTITYSDVTAGYFNDLHTASGRKEALEPNLAFFQFQNRNKLKIGLKGNNLQIDSLQPNLEMNVYKTIDQDSGTKEAITNRNEDPVSLRKIPNLLETSNIKQEKSVWNGEKIKGTNLEEGRQGVLHLADGDVFVPKKYKNQGGDIHWIQTTVGTRGTYDKSNKQFSSTADKDNFIHTGDSDKKVGREDVNIHRNKIDEIAIQGKMVFHMNRGQKDKIHSGSLCPLTKLNNPILEDLHTSTIASSKKITEYHGNDEGSTKNKILVIRYYNRMPKLERTADILSNEEDQTMKAEDKSLKNLAIPNLITDKEQKKYLKFMHQKDDGRLLRPEQYTSQKFRDEKDAPGHFEKILGPCSESTLDGGSHGSIDSQLFRKEINRDSSVSLNKKRKLLTPRMKLITISDFTQLEGNVRQHQLQGDHFLSRGRAEIQKTEDPYSIQSTSLVPTFITLEKSTIDRVPFIYNHSFAVIETTDKSRTSPYAEFFDGVQAMRIVDKVLSKVQQSKDLSDEFGLCKTNLEKIREEIFPLPIESKERGSIDMRFTVPLENNKQSSSTCIILTPETRTFLEWLLYNKPSEQNEAPA